MSAFAFNDILEGMRIFVNLRRRFSFLDTDRLLSLYLIRHRHTEGASNIKRNLFGFSFIIGFCLSALFAQNPPSGWKGKIETENEADVFNADGFYIYRASVPENTLNEMGIPIRPAIQSGSGVRSAHPV